MGASETDEIWWSVCLGEDRDEEGEEDGGRGEMAGLSNLFSDGSTCRTDLGWLRSGGRDVVCSSSPRSPPLYTPIWKAATGSGSLLLFGLGCLDSFIQPFNA